MQYQLIGSTMQALVIELAPGESCYTESGAMAWMDQTIHMDSNFKGGVFSSIGRLFTGESLALTTFTAQGGPGRVTFAPHVPGKVVPVQLGSGPDLIVQKHSFLAAQAGVEVKVHWNKRIWGGLFGGEGFILQRLSGSGMAFIEIDGEVVEQTLAPGETLRVSTGHVAAFEEGVQFDITTVKGIKNWFLGGEGLFLTTLTGPGEVWLQTLPFSSLVRKIASALPNRNHNSGANVIGSLLERV